MRTMLVTGGAGFIGSRFVHEVVASTDHRVVVLDDLRVDPTARALEGVPSDRVELVVGDVTDARLVDDLVREAHVVVDFAAESHNDRSLADPRPFVETNVLGAYTILEAVRAHDVRLHHISTDEVFGDLALEDRRRFTEDSAYRPSSPYAATKAAADLLVTAWVRSFGVRATISHCSNNYGPFQHVEKFIPRQITNILSGERPRLYGTGANVRDWIHVDDHARAVLAIIESGRVGRTYLIGANDPRDNRSIVEMILRLMGEPPDAFDLVPDRPGHDRRYAIDASALRREVGWTPRVLDFEAALAETIDWYATHRDWWAGAKTATEAAYRAQGR